jgi:hypothetical protein
VRIRYGQFAVRTAGEDHPPGDRKQYSAKEKIGIVLDGLLGESSIAELCCREGIAEAPAGDDWLHEIKYDGYRIHARLEHGRSSF